MGGNQAFDRLAFRGHSATFGFRYRLGHIGELSSFLIGQSADAKSKRSHQRPMDDQVRVAPDRRGEMRVTAEIETEVANILGAVLGLRLGAQYDLVDEIRSRQRFRLSQNAIEVCRPQLSWRQSQIQRLQELPERRKLLLR